MGRWTRWVAGLLLVAACAHKTPPPAPAPAPAPRPTGPATSGLASWYGAAFAGKPTASGRPFDPDALTAAHRTYAFGTLVRVTRSDTGQQVTVVITDRGPYAGGRIIDLSEAAARTLDMIAIGTTRVTLTRLGCDPGFPNCR